MSELTDAEKQVLSETGLECLEALRGNITAFEKGEDALLKVVTSLNGKDVEIAASLIAALYPDTADLLRELVREAAKYRVYMERC